MGTAVDGVSIYRCTALGSLIVCSLLGKIIVAVTDTLSKVVQGIIDKPWNTRKGQKVPSSSDVTLAGGAVELYATFLYADLAASSIQMKSRAPSWPIERICSR